MSNTLIRENQDPLCIGCFHFVFGTTRHCQSVLGEHVSWRVCVAKAKESSACLFDTYIQVSRLLAAALPPITSIYDSILPTLGTAYHRPHRLGALVPHTRKSLTDL